jgi:hypothetical protein
VRSFRANGIFATLAAAGVLTALLFGNVTTAHAKPRHRAEAVRMAKAYLRSQPFSFKGLVKELKYDRFSTSDATYGARHSGANWLGQAVRMAKNYLRARSFSFKGMVEQLEYEGFTHAQAVHGARGAGL